MDKAKVLSSNVIYDTEQNMLKTLLKTRAMTTDILIIETLKTKRQTALTYPAAILKTCFFAVANSAIATLNGPVFAIRHLTAAILPTATLKTATGKRPEFRTVRETAEISAAAALRNASGRTVPSVMRIFPGLCSKVRMSGAANFAKRFCPKSNFS